MAVVHHVHKVFGRAVSTGHTEVTDGLIAPRTGEGVFADRHQLDVRKAHLFAVVDQLMRQVAIVHPAMRAGWIATP